MSKHGPFEKGKDIITRTPSGEVRAYQLKAGNIGLGEWRIIYGEITNLVELAIELPGEKPITNFVPYLVTNGQLTDPVLEQVRVGNITWQQRGINNQLHLIQEQDLCDRFKVSHGAYLPHQLQDFRTFLELILRDGAAPAAKKTAAQLIEHVLPDTTQCNRPVDAARAAASLVLLTAYITGPATLKTNYWAVFEYWVLTAAYILHLIEKFHAAESECDVSFRLCEMAAENALYALAEECERCGHLVQGMPLIDGHVYRARATILVGLLSAWDLFLRVQRRCRPKADFVRLFLNRRLREATVWGESAVTYLYLAALEAEENCAPLMAEGLIIQLIREISAANGASATGRGVPSPYYSAEESLRVNFGLDFLNDEQFLGLSYSISTLVDFLARRWRRQALASLWFGVTRISLVSYVPANFSEWYRWNSSDGILDSHLPGEPQSWEALRTNAETISVEELPPTLRERPAFALWFVLVYPHRFTRATAKLIEDALSGQ